MSPELSAVLGDVGPWAASAVVSLLAWLMRRAISGLESSISLLGTSLGARLDALAAVVSSHNTEVAVLRTQVEHLAGRLERVESMVQQVREG